MIIPLSSTARLFGDKYRLLLYYYSICSQLFLIASALYFSIKMWMVEEAIWVRRGATTMPPPKLSSWFCREKQTAQSQLNLNLGFIYCNWLSKHHIAVLFTWLKFYALCVFSLTNILTFQLSILLEFGLIRRWSLDSSINLISELNVNFCRKGLVGRFVSWKVLFWRL